MIYNLQQLDDDSVNYLLQLVKKSRDATKSELDIINQNSDGLIDYSSKGKGPMTLTLLSINDNIELVEFFQKYIGINKNEITSIHLNQYNETAKTLPHRDTNSSRTYLILLSVAEQGGELVLENEIIPFNKIGQVIDYDGGKIMHGVNEIKKGFRTTLVVWTKPKSII